MLTVVPYPWHQSRQDHDETGIRSCIMHIKCGFHRTIEVVQLPIYMMGSVSVKSEGKYLRNSTSKYGIVIGSLIIIMIVMNLLAYLSNASTSNLLDTSHLH